MNNTTDENLIVELRKRCNELHIRTVKGLLADIIPDQRLKRNVLFFLYEEGLIEELTSDQFDMRIFNRYYRIMVRDYGMNESIILWGLKVWKNVFESNCSISDERIEKTILEEKNSVIDEENELTEQQYQFIGNNEVIIEIINQLKKTNTRDMLEKHNSNIDTTRKNGGHAWGKLRQEAIDNLSIKFPSMYELCWINIDKTEGVGDRAAKYVNQLLWNTIDSIIPEMTETKEIYKNSVFSFTFNPVYIDISDKKHVIGGLQVELRNSHLSKYGIDYGKKKKEFRHYRPIEIRPNEADYFEIYEIRQRGNGKM